MKYATESLAQVRDEIIDLAKRHYDEVAEDKDVVPLDIDWGHYAGLERNRALRIFTARVDEKLVGYNVFVLTFHPRYKTTLFAQNDVIFVHPEHRGRGGEFVDFSDEQLKSDGVVKATYHVKVKHDWSPMIRQKGYAPQDIVLTKVL